MIIEIAKKTSDFWYAHKEEDGRVLFHFLIGRMNGNRERHTRICVKTYNDFKEKEAFFTVYLSKKHSEAVDFVIKDFFK